MHQLTALLALLGSCACLMDGIGRPFREWAPSAVVLTVMAAMVRGAGGAALTVGACALAAVAVWTALAGPSDGRPGGRGPAVVDLTTMVLLTACASRPGHGLGLGLGMDMPGTAAPYDVRLFLLLVVCWALARAAVRLAALVGWSRPPPTDGAGVGARRMAALHAGGSAAMIIAMSAMLA
ncbi:hypothetical protein [Streptomyces sp. NPDC059224]|uniref:hypothetical protein n=1 Tax=Streptomyces sp. NPDC059224 TaxID=3346775 RepID=UPI00369C17F9